MALKKKRLYYYSVNSLSLFWEKSSPTTFWRNYVQNDFKEVKLRDSREMLFFFFLIKKWVLNYHDDFLNFSSLTLNYRISKNKKSMMIIKSLRCLFITLKDLKIFFLHFFHLSKKDSLFFLCNNKYISQKIESGFVLPVNKISFSQFY